MYMTMRLSTDLSRREEGREMESEKKHDLFDYAMKGMWEKVVEIYEKYPKAREAKITKFEDTALHIAVTNGETATVLKLVDILKLENANTSRILNMKNARGNTPLHLAAALGDVGMCQSMATIDEVIINVEGETPLFLAALYGHEKAFLCLHSFYPEETSWRNSNGDTILHSAISGEYFSKCLSFFFSSPSLTLFIF
jgi:ankyrin repeat protein